MELGYRRRLEEESAQAWPYRTTPLVLPGAKAKHEKELAPTESYLRHHPNPMMRAAPSQYELLPQEVLMKQKVADSVLQKVAGDEAFAGKQVVHKQFNSPIGLYSDQNILDTIQHQTGISASGSGRSPFVSRPSGRSMAPKKTIVYDPAKSETFKALQEEQFGDHVQEVTSPAQPKVFTPNVHAKKIQHQPPQSHTYDPLTRSTASPSLQHHLPYVNSMGHSEEHIAQSGTFKRLMHMVMGESEY
ncbi:UNVERIFIED_CONTAM: hypothetical protein PYX00_008908 [Menopon gallinae]|uniref:Zasp-like motif domain-containing protein n=1 Tax=Menopon gallinae TaxID=328185 RepID=A0AAW2H9D5_9NEOP